MKGGGGINNIRKYLPIFRDTLITVCCLGSYICTVALEAGNRVCIHMLSNVHGFLSTPTPSAAAVNWLGSEAQFWETQDQLSPRHFGNAGSNLFFYEECSYLVNIKPKHSRICWYKNIYSPKYFSPAYVSVSEGGVFQSFPRQRFLA